VLKTALASAATLVVFACSMFFFSGLEATLSASVFSAAAAALLLALCPPGSDVVSIAVGVGRGQDRSYTFNVQ